MNPASDSVDLTRLDVWGIPCRVKHAQILQRWLELRVGECFVLLNDHDPIPLRDQFEAQFPRAFTWEYLQRGPDQFRVKLTRLISVSVPPGTLAAPCSPGGTAHPAKENGIQQIDARGLEPPEPLIRILNALESLPDGTRLRAITDRRPCHLFGEAEQRGFRHDSAEQPDGSWVTVLARS